MITPCATCKRSGRCSDEEITCREAVFCWLQGAPLGCEDYEPRYYHGIEGVFDDGVDLVGGVGRSAGQYGRGVRDVSVRYLGVK